jgi:CBS domain-containing protein
LLVRPRINCYYSLASVKVKDIMVKDVLCSLKTEKLIEAAHVIIGAHASCLVVIDHEKPVGIITERDFVKKLPMERDHSSEMIVNDLMTKQIFSVSHNANLIEAQKIMREHKFRKLVVIDNEQLKGIITQTDLCWAVANLGAAIRNPPLVYNLMSRKVLTVGEDDKFSKAKKLMAWKDTGSVIIVDEGELKGMFTEFDLVSEFFMNPNHLRNSYMKELMTSPVVCITPDFDIFQINNIMLYHNFRRLPVLENNKLVGIITQTDVARGMYEFLERNKAYEYDPKVKTKEPIFCVRKAGNIILYEKRKEQKEQQKKEQPKKK